MSANNRARGYKTASRGVATEAEPAPETTTQKHSLYVYMRVLRWKMAPLDNSLTDTMQHHVFQLARQQYAAEVLRCIIVYQQAPTTQL